MGVLYRPITVILRGAKRSRRISLGTAPPRRSCDFAQDDGRDAARYVFCLQLYQLRQECSGWNDDGGLVFETIGFYIIKVEGKLECVSGAGLGLE